MKQASELTGRFSKRSYMLHYLMISFLLFSSAILLHLEGQTPLISNNQDLFTFIQSDLDYLNNKMEKYSRIEGSPYLDEDFVSGSVLHQRKKYVNLDLRYNHYEGYFEFSIEDGFKYIDPRRTRLDTVWMGELTFVFVNYRHGNSIRQAFMELANQGDTKLFLLNQVTLTEAEPAKGYAEARPAKFQKRPEYIYLEVPGQPAIQFKGKNSVKEVFPDNANLLLAHVKKEKLKLKNLEDIAELCRYYDSLQQ